MGAYARGFIKLAYNKDEKEQEFQKWFDLDGIDVRDGADLTVRLTSDKPPVGLFFEAQVPAIGRMRITIAGVIIVLSTS